MGNIFETCFFSAFDIPNPSAKRGLCFILPSEFVAISCSYKGKIAIASEISR